MHTHSSKLRCNHAYIDAANLDKGTMKEGWRVDFHRFYRWLHERHRIKRAYIFIGYMPNYSDLYARMREAGFLVRFKDVVLNEHSSVKGNCDTDLAVRAVRDAYESVFDRAVIVSSDGDFTSLVSFFKENNRLGGVISPNRRCSKLITQQSVPITYLYRIRGLVECPK